MKKNNTMKLSNGRELGYAEFGDMHGKPLFFFHGYPSSRLGGRIVHNAAKKLGLHIISLDRPGYGLSDFQYKRTLLDWPNDIVEVANTLNIKKFSILGVSGGAPYAAVCVYKIPERIIHTGIVSGLAPLQVKALRKSMSLSMRIIIRLYQTFPKSFSHLGTIFFIAQAKKLFPDSFSYSLMRKADKKLMTKSYKNALATSRKETFRHGNKAAAWDFMLYTSPWGFDIKDIHKKVYLWYGTEDKVIPPTMGEYYAAQIKNSKLTLHPNESHFLIKTHTEEILATFQKTS